MSETPNPLHPSPSSAELTLDLKLDPEPVASTELDSRTVADGEPMASVPFNDVGRAVGDPPVPIEPPTLGELVDGQAVEQPSSTTCSAPAAASGMAPGADPPG